MSVRLLFIAILLGTLFLAAAADELGKRRKGQTEEI